MRTTRWKIMAGGVALSLGGLAALAGIPAKSSIVSCSPSQIETVQRAVPAEDALPPSPAAAAKAIDPVVPEVRVNPMVAPPGSAPAPIVIPGFDAPTPKTTVSEFKIQSIKSDHLPLPSVAETPIVPQTAPSRMQMPEPQTPVQPINTTTKHTQHTVPSQPVPPAQPMPIPEQVAQTRAMEPVSMQKTGPSPRLDTTVSPQIGMAEAPAETVMIDRKVKVLVTIGDGNPRLEVRDGEEILLRVVSEKIDVKAPSDQGAVMSILKASGKVTFVTPGGEGVCDELNIVPGSGQVIVAGGVHFKYHWGKVETAVTGERMTFRLGSVPNTEAAQPRTAVPTSFGRNR